MGSTRSIATQRRVFALAVPIVVVLVAGFVLILDPGVPLETRQIASSAGLLLAGLAVMVCCGWRSAQTSGRRRRSWRLFTAAGLVAMAANVVGVFVGSDNVGSPSLLTDLVIIPAMLLSIAGLVTFPNARRRGADSVVLALDGLVTGGGILAIAAVLVYPELLASTTEGLAERATELLFPVLDLVLVTVALLLVLRARGPDRPSLLLIGGGFMAYAVTDLGFAVLEAAGRLRLRWAARPGLDRWATCDRPGRPLPQPERGRTCVGTRSHRPRARAVPCWSSRSSSRLGSSRWRSGRGCKARPR